MKNQTNKKGKGLMVILCIVGVLVIMMGIVIARVVFLTSPTKGEKIGDYDAPKSALVVVDLQKDTLSIPLYTKTQEKLERVNAIIVYAQSQDIPVIYIKQEYLNTIDSLFSGGRYQKDSVGAGFVDELQVVSQNTYSKYRADTFSTNEFESFLVENQIDTLYLVGADASACVLKTALGGVNRGYHVSVLKDCLFSMDEKNIETILAKYKKANVDVVLSDDIMKQ